MRLGRFLALWGPVLAYAGVLYALSDESRLPPIAGLLWDKMEHASAWMGLTLLALRATHGGRGPLRRGAAIAAAVLAVAYAFADEIHQSFVPGRDSSLLDVLADAVGTGCAVAVAAAWSGWRRRRGPPGRAEGPDRRA